MFTFKGADHALGMLAAAKSKKDYVSAKRFVARLDRQAQLAMVDSIRGCRARLISQGVL